MLFSGNFKSCQAQAKNVKLLCSCHLRVSNEEDDTAAPKQVMLLTLGVNFMIFLRSVTCFHWPKLTVTVTVLPLLLTANFLPITAPVSVSIVGHNNSDTTLSLPSGNCYALNGHWIALNCCLDVQNMVKVDKLCFLFCCFLFSVFFFSFWMALRGCLPHVLADFGFGMKHIPETIKTHL